MCICISYSHLNCFTCTTHLRLHSCVYATYESYAHVHSILSSLKDTNSHFTSKISHIPKYSKIMLLIISVSVKSLITQTVQQLTSSCNNCSPALCPLGSIQTLNSVSKLITGLLLAAFSTDERICN